MSLRPKSDGLEVPTIAISSDSLQPKRAMASVASKWFSSVFPLPGPAARGSAAAASAVAGLERAAGRSSRGSGTLQPTRNAVAWVHHLNV